MLGHLAQHKRDAMLSVVLPLRGVTAIADCACWDSNSCANQKTEFRTQVGQICMLQVSAEQK